MDLIYSGTLLPAIALIGGAALLLSRVVDGEGSIFHQDRIGKDGSLFTIRKIRTLEADGLHPAWGGPHDSRATPLGEKLRPYGIDEIPQFLNVFKGEMSLVGPRASSSVVLEAMQQTLRRTGFDEWQNMYFSSRPGLISSFGLAARLVDFSEEQALVKRAELDLEDFRQASREYDRKLLFSYWGVMSKVISKSLRSQPYASSVVGERVTEDEFGN